MTTDEAKRILLMHRPWAKDAEGPEMAEALALCQKDPALARWHASHCALQLSLHRTFQNVKAPEGLLQQIVAERPRPVAPRPAWRRTLVAAMACAVTTVALWTIWRTQVKPEADLSFSGYRARMARTALRAYGMDLETNDLSAIQAHLAAHQAPADFVLPAALNQASVIGCGALKWQSKPVTMICFQTGKPLPPGMKSDLILFVIQQEDVLQKTPLTEKPDLEKVSEWFTASWRSGDKLYLLAALDEQALRGRL